MSLKIMVVDHEPKTPNLVRALATPMGYSVAPFADYQTAGQKGETQHFDVCFVGMELDQADGLNVAHRIRNSEPNRDSIIVMLATGDDIACRRKAFGEGADLILNKPLPSESMRRMLAAFSGWKCRRVLARLPLFTDVTCIWNDHEFKLRSLNISGSGMLLQPAPEIEVGAEISLAFRIPEIRAALDVRARVVRKEGSQGIAAEFIGLAPEDLNAIHLYVTGQPRDNKPVRDDLPPLGTRRIFGP